MSLGAVQPGTRGYDSGLAHELEHLLQWRLDPAEETWVNEGTAELAIRAVGLDPSGNYQSFLQQPDTQLNDWAEEVGRTPAHYGASELFFSYVGQRFGGYAIVGEILARPERGIAGYRGRAAAARQPGSTSRRASSTGRSRTGPASPARTAATATLTGPPVRVRDQPIALPTRVEASVHQFAARYFALPRGATGTLSSRRRCEARLVAAPERPDPIWWSNRSRQRRQPPDPLGRPLAASSGRRCGSRPGTTSSATSTTPTWPRRPTAVRPGAPCRAGTPAPATRPARTTGSASPARAAPTRRSGSKSRST